MGQFGIAEQLLHGAVEHHRSLVQDDGIGGQTFGDTKVLFHQQDCGVGCHLLQCVHHVGDDGRSQSLAGLVHQQQLVVVQQGPGDGQHLLLSA